MQPIAPCIKLFPAQTIAIEEIMKPLNIADLSKQIDELEQQAGGLDAEIKLLDILQPLLEAEGYDVEHTGGPGDYGIDFLARKTDRSKSDLPSRLGIQYKHRRAPIGVSDVQQVIGASLLGNLDRMILLSKSGFSQQAWEIAKRDLPTAIELVDINTLRAWIERVGRKTRADYSKVIKAISELSKELAKFIANDPSELINIEWRDMERVLATVFDGLGFKVELTPSSKDGGKDIVLEFNVLGVNQSFVVEVKHWRSKQKVGQGRISHFVNVVANERRQGGLYLATYGYSQDAFEALTEVERSRFYAGSEEKIVSLCRTFVKAESGLWSTPTLLTDVIIENTLPFD